MFAGRPTSIWHLAEAGPFVSAAPWQDWNWKSFLPQCCAAFPVCVWPPGLTSITPDWFFAVHTDGGGYKKMVIEAGGFRDRFNDDPRKHSVTMDGAAIFNFTIKRVPQLIEDSLRFAEIDSDAVDYFLFHQSNQFILKHLIKKSGLPIEKAPIFMREYGNTGGVSVPMAFTLGGLDRPADRALRTLLLGYGVGLSWGSALVDLDPDAILDHVELDNTLDLSA